MTSIFDRVQQTGNRFAKNQVARDDTRAIEDILKKAPSANKKEHIERLLSEVVSRVSPERQQTPLALLANRYDEISKLEARERQRESYKAGGINPAYADYPDALQSQLVKNEGEIRSQQEFYGNGVKQDSQERQSGPERPSSNTTQRVQPPFAPGKEPSTVRNVPQGNRFATATDEDLAIFTGSKHKFISEPAKREIEKREQEKKEGREDKRERRKETQEYRTNLFEKGDLAKKSIENKSRQIELIDKGNINDPTYAQLLDQLPWNIGKRFLSPDTVQYKAGLVEGFGDLKTIFTGATRVKEIEILEGKIADIYLTDEQKKAILKAGINVSKADLIMAEAAEEVDLKYPDLSLTEFRKKVKEVSDKKLDELGKGIIGEINYILDQAEVRKRIPLDDNDPEDAKIIDQALAEAGDDEIKATKALKERGYKILD
jgi:hypothetical protein